MGAKKPKLTVKEAKLAKAKAKGLKHTEAWDEAGYSQNSSDATKIANTQKILSKPSVQEALQVALNKYNITPDKIAQRVSEGMDAEKVSIVGNGEQAMAEITPDHSIRLKATGMAAQFMGIGKDRDGGNNQNFIQIINEKGSKYND